MSLFGGFSQPYLPDIFLFPLACSTPHVGCAFTACTVPPPVRSHYTHPALAFRDTFPTVLNPLCAVSVPLLVSLPGADPWLLLHCVMPWKNHLHLFSAKFLVEASAFTCGCRFWLSEQKGGQELPAGSLREGSGVFGGSGAASAGAVSTESPVLLPAPLAAAPTWPVHAFPQLSEPCQGRKHYPNPDVCS